MPKRDTPFLVSQRQHILDAARHCFIQQGYDRTTIREVAEKAQVSTGAIYTYFPTKGSMLSAICMAQAEAQQQALRQVVGNETILHASFSALLRVALAPFLSLSPDDLRQRELLDLLFWYESTREPAIGQQLQQAMAQWRQTVATALRERQTQEALAPNVDPEILAEILVCFPFGMVLYDILAQRQGDHQALLTVLGTVLDHGLRPTNTSF